MIAERVDGLGWQKFVPAQGCRVQNGLVKTASASAAGGPVAEVESPMPMHPPAAVAASIAYARASGERRGFETARDSRTAGRVGGGDGDELTLFLSWRRRGGGLTSERWRSGEREFLM
jgi:hypothetical protein